MATLGPYHNMVVQSFIYWPSSVNKSSDNNPSGRKGLNQALDNPVSRTQGSRHDPALISALTIGGRNAPHSASQIFWSSVYGDVHVRYTSHPSWSSLIYTFPFVTLIEEILNVLNGGISQEVMKNPSLMSPKSKSMDSQIFWVNIVPFVIAGTHHKDLPCAIRQKWVHWSRSQPMKSAPPEMLAFQNPYWYSFVSLSGSL